MSFRAAGPDDADAVAALHTDSWQRHYRGACSDGSLDGDVPPPGGDPARLPGNPMGPRYVWRNGREATRGRAG